MSEILHLILSHTLELIIFWILTLIFLLYYFRKVYWSLADPFVISIVLIISPGVSGLVCIAIFLEPNQGFHFKSVVFFASFFLFLLGFKHSFRKKTIAPHQFYIDAGYKWQAFTLSAATALILINLIVNGNFESDDPSSRFTNVTVPTLNYFSIALTAYPAFFFTFTRVPKIRFMALAYIAAIALIQINAGASKSFFISWVMIYLYWLFSRNELNKNQMLHNLNRLTLSTSGVKIVLFSLFLITIGLFYLFSKNLTDSTSIFIRFLLTFDSPAIFIAQEEIQLDTSQTLTGFFTFLDVWTKPFLKNIFSLNFPYENISQYLTYEMTGYRSTDYSETSWQPNNNILVDFLVIHGWPGVVLSYISGYLLGRSYYYIKSKDNISKTRTPIFVLIIITPFYVFIDAQSFFTSAILGFTFIYLINFYFNILSFQSKNKIR